MKPKVYAIRSRDGWQWVVRLDGELAQATWEIDPKTWMFNSWSAAMGIVTQYWEAVGGYRTLRG